MGDKDFLVPGETCWRCEQAERFRIIVDGADYFPAVKHAMLNARHTIMMIGWDFDTRIEFEPGGESTLEGPNTLGKFLDWMAHNKEGIQLYMLKWDLGTIQSLQRGMVPMAVRPMRMSKNFRFKLDSAHPAGAAHHSKIIVIDDQIAFCGGIDMTEGRWDTREHLDEQPNRRLAGHDEILKPWHDVTTAVTGPLAKALGDLARQRWYRATGEELEPPEKGGEAIWPELDTTLEDVPVAIARTYPDYKDYDEEREIEALYLKAIASVRETFYVETQYLASAKIAKAIAQRLREPDGPEFIVVLPQKAEGWLRQKAMDGARERLLKYLWANDPHGRFTACYPVTEGGAAIYVHAKVLVVDDWLIRVGSSNLNNRSMGFDTECDLAVDAGICSDPDAVSRTILGVRRDLVCEHLGISGEQYDEVLAETGRLLPLIERLRSDGRTLREFTPGEVEEDANVLAENEFADPEEVGEGLGERISHGLEDLLENCCKK